MDDEVQEGTENSRRTNLPHPQESSFLADLISTIEFNEDGELLAVGDKGGRIVVFQREQQVRILPSRIWANFCFLRLRRQKHHHIGMNTMFTSHFIRTNRNSII